ncbi:MAG: alpha/beta hydrolase [Dehalococcoidia bacterium]|jgi:pimeloyl-ACP methyl ester carboxylesterase|nr:alpha/beta hydrolase [Dehalococcoidia bacterium]
MPYVTSSGRRLYYEVAGAGFPLLMHHGFAQSAQSWVDSGWRDLLATRSRVISFDILGHGRSDTPHDIEAYRMEERMADVIAVAEAGGAQRFDMLGFSLGGRVALGMAFRRPECLRGLIVGGMHARATALTAEGMNRRTATLRKGSVRALKRALGQNSKSSNELPDPDPEALALSDEGLLDWPGVVEDLHSLELPTLMFVGEQDRMQPWVEEDAAAIPNVNYVCCPDVDHTGAFDRSDLAGPSVVEFLSRLPDANAGPIP